MKCHMDVLLFSTPPQKGVGQATWGRKLLTVRTDTNKVILRVPLIMVVHNQPKSAPFAN